MLRPVFAISALATVVVLSGCQSIMGHRAMSPFNTNNSGTQVSHATNTRSNNPSKSAIDYNQWQWKYLSNQATKNHSSASNSIFVQPPVVTAESPVGNVWGYDYQPNTVHPSHWGSVTGSEKCSTGQQQSPINITQALIPAKTDVSKIQYHYQPQDFIVTNDGHTLAFTAVDQSASKFIANGKEYQLVKFQYHSPSEHAIMNVNYPLELQFVHKNSDGETAILATLVNIGQQNSSLQTVIDSLPSGIVKNPQKKLTGFDVSSLIPKKYLYAYTGSLTRPPCSENTAWLIGSQTIKASSEQVYNLRSRFYGNNRPIQPQNNRTVFMIK